MVQSNVNAQEFKKRVRRRNKRRGGRRWKNNSKNLSLSNLPNKNNKCCIFLENFAGKQFSIINT